jgi:hypothetical protein
VIQVRIAYINGVILNMNYCISGDQESGCRSGRE